jgi:transposase
MSVTRLRSLYRKAGVRFGKPEHVLDRALEIKQTLRVERFEFAREFQRLDRLRVVYVDETSFNPTYRITRVWQYRNQRIEIQIPNNRPHGVTIFGASGHSIDPLYMMAKSTSKEAFLDFLKMIKNEVKDTETVIVLDNHGAHTSDLCVDYARINGLTLKFIPRYSCRFNSQERVWSSIKREYSRLMSVETAKIDTGKMEELIWKAINTTVVTPAMIDSNRCYIEEIISLGL